MTEMEKQRKIDALTEELGEFFETAQNDVTTKLSLHLMSEGNKAALKNTLNEEEKRINGLTELYASRAKSIVDFDTSKVIQKGKQGTRMLIRNALSDYTKKVQRVHRLERIMPLRDAIFKQTQEGIKNGIPVTYKNGRKVGYKEYMEMNVRTTLQQNIGEKQLELGSQANVVFYLCNTYADCADDHADYQGKMYYDERYKSFNLKSEIQNEIEKHIRKTDMISVQDVKSEAPYLTTRPNCRHTLTPISIDQALNIDTKTLLQELKLARGSYKPKNYKDMQEQRYNERMVRKYKARSSINQELLAQDPNNELLKRQIALDNTRVRQYQGKLRTLVKSNPVLERDYRKETREILLKDLGAKYNLSKVPKVVDVPPTPTTMVTTFSNDIPIMWTKFRGDRQASFAKTWDLFKDKINTVEQEYGYSQTREHIGAFYKKFDKLFDAKIVYDKSARYRTLDNSIGITPVGEDSSDDRTIETVIHEFGHAIDSNITQKVFGQNTRSISEGMWRLEDSVKDRIRSVFRGKIPKDEIKILIDEETQKIRNKISAYTPKQKRLYEASNEFSYSIQAEIKKGLATARSTELYQKVKAFDKRRDEIRNMHKSHPEYKDVSEKANEYGNQVSYIEQFLNNQSRAKINTAKDMKEYFESKVKDSARILQEKGIDINNIEEELESRKALSAEFMAKRRSIILSFEEKRQQALKEYEKNEIYMSQASDFLDAISLGNFQTNFELRYGHGRKYYSGNSGFSEVEIFTHLATTSVASPDVYNLIKKDYPEIVSKFEQLTQVSYELMEADINE